MNDFMIKINRRIFGDDYFKERRHITDPDETVYYIVRRVPLGEGFFSNYFYVLSHVVYACEKGWRPVVDMEHYKTLYTDDGTSGNLWERYFEPMDDVTLKQAYQSKNYVLSSGRYLAGSGVPVYEKEHGRITDEMVQNLQGYVARYMKIRPAIINDIERFKKESRWDGFKMIGVHVRGTDMHVAHTGHTVSPKVEEMIDRISVLMKTDDRYKLFLCTDEQKVVETFLQIYNEKVIYCKEYRSTSGKEVGIHKDKRPVGRKDHRFLMGKEILSDAILLSQCDGLICGISNVTNAAVLFNNKRYSNVQIVGKSDKVG